MSDLSDISLSVLDLAPVATGQTAADAFRNTLELARSAERWGYKRYWLAEHHNLPGIASSATSVLIGYVAAGTSRIRVGSGGIMLPNHAPLVIAEQFGTLESLYPGRIDLGLGRAPGTDSITSYALRRGLTSDGHDFPELLAELQRYLTASDRDLKVHAYPGSGLNIPIWLLGSSTFSARLAADLGLPFSFASHFAPDELDQALKLYRSKFKPSAHLERPYVMVGVPVIAADTDALASKLATTTSQKFLGLVRRQPVQAKPPVDNIDEIWNEYEKAAVLSRMAIAAIGGPDTVARKLGQLLERTRADELIVVSDFFDFQDRLRSYEILSNLCGAAKSAQLPTINGVL
ncbi:MAG: LLM class flavin-dependent oxidoreductase [Candidatus Melainabacteria bacterium]|nr:MAG: LLM class flavin-dependent oxidoreductase [Candidatus Melainabacteria bacterium]